MKKILFVLAVTNFVFISEISAQNSNQTPTRRNCSYVSRPIIDIGGNIVIGKALKLPKPKLSKKAKKIAQNTSVTVNIIVDETGKVISAQADTENPLLQIPTEQAAIKSKFRVSLSSGEPVKVEMELIYYFEKTRLKSEFYRFWNPFYQNRQRMKITPIILRLIYIKLPECSTQKLESLSTNHEQKRSRIMAVL